MTEDNVKENCLEEKIIKPLSSEEGNEIADHPESLQTTILALLNENKTHLQQLNGLIQDRLQYDSAKEKAFDRLYQEMNKQKESFALVDRTIKPILTEMLLLFDSMGRVERSLIDGDGFSKEEIIRNFRFIIDELLEVLYRLDVTPIDTNDSEKYNTKLHKAVKTVTTDNKEDDFAITGILRTGFMWRDLVLRPQEVIIQRYLQK